jgi:hypothetical protein
MGCPSTDSRQTFIFNFLMRTRQGGSPVTGHLPEFDASVVSANGFQHVGSCSDLSGMLKSLSRSHLAKLA